ncbi:MAG: PEP/pyruvate-binding domain-containing protein, partial [Xanthomonadales bacterium]|nr:PEP/pyruvate-binding domain-containing protein [Xanthomonadales bacterium]
ALRPALETLTRAELLNLADASLRGAFGAGLINARLYEEALGELGRLTEAAPTLAQYRRGLSYLGWAPAWGSQALRMHFGEAMLKLTEIEPLADLFIQDQLRGSPLFFQTQVLDPLVRDANRMAGVSHRLFGREVGTGLTALNPGLARGVLHVDADPADPERMRSDGIYLLDETVAELPPVAGILTSGEGNPLSHVQLLARNLGIPNVAVDDSILLELAAQAGREVVLAVSAAGVVEMAPADGRWDGVFQQARATDKVVIRPDLDKLDLETRGLLPLDSLRGTDSGRSVGPKAAQLGELRAHYPDKVARGLAIPFGVFVEEVLARPYAGDSGEAEWTVREWMSQQYRALQALPAGSPERAERTELFREELHAIVSATIPSEEFRHRLSEALRQVFAPGTVPGLFIRSDTNVEDLPGFTGAGLNLTLPNVVGFDALIEGIPRVWASPFTARAFAWRQALMDAPEHVYSSILLLESVPVEKSGVLVTQDLDSGDRRVISVAVNEGLGGAVDGQAAESLRIGMDTGQVRVLATATAPWRRVLNPNGGLERVRASGSDTVLRDADIGQLIRFVEGLPSAFPPLLNDEGGIAAADVEFGFADGRLRLFQIRPFLESRQARGSQYLREMDSRLVTGEDVTVDLSKVPQP